MGPRYIHLPICCGLVVLVCQVVQAQVQDSVLPSRSTAPSVQFGQGFQDIAPSPAQGKQGSVQTLPKVEPPEGTVRGREAVITSELKGLVFVEKEDQIKADGVSGVQGVSAFSELLKKNEFALRKIGRAHV